MKNTIVIIGAPRSGTNMLRNILTSCDGVVTWPCDEINYIWRHGNIRYPSDELPSDLASPQVCQYIRNCFDKCGQKKGVEIVVEKTCANSLRVPFVHKVLPEAKYIYIYRDGIDVAASAKLRWKAKLDIPYLFEKAKYVPKSDLPYYGTKYLLNRVYQMLSSEKRLAFWGPTLNDMQHILKSHNLIEICALQWQRCVENAEEAFGLMDKEKVHKVAYEKFIASPETEFAEILKFIGKEISDKQLRHAVAQVSTVSVGKGRTQLTEAEVVKLEKLVGNTLLRYGYDKS